MDVAAILAIVAGSSVVTALVTTAANGAFGWAKGKADVVSLYTDMAADTAVRNRELVAAIEGLTDAVDRIVPMLEAHIGVSTDDHAFLQGNLDALKHANSAARVAI
jgi:hypothetical protein